MNLLKLDATDSTNSALRELNRDDALEAWTVLWAEYQRNGRGQQGASWYSDKGKNLTFSILYKPDFLKVKDQFLLNCAISIGIFKALKKFRVPRLKVKWPNDIMSGPFKLGGILVENSVMRDKIGSSIIGIGINVNQDSFPSDLPRAISMKQLLNKSFDRELLLREMVECIRSEAGSIGTPAAFSLLQNYENLLYKKDSAQMFRDLSGAEFPGKILGISETGLLRVEKEDESVGFYGFKEIVYL